MRVEAMGEEHREAVLEMMRVFYASPAVHTNGSEAIFRSDIDACLSDEPWLEGYVFLEGDAPIGYTMLATGYSTEFGRRCVWIEDLYVKPEYRHKGIGTEFFRFLPEAYPQAVRFKLEVEPENETAMALYKKSGYYLLGYSIMAQEK